MDARVMSIETLPVFIGENIKAPKVSVQESGDGFLIVPIRDEGGSKGKKADMNSVRSLRGILKGTDYTHEKIREERLGKYLNEVTD